MVEQDLHELTSDRLASKTMSRLAGREEEERTVRATKFSDARLYPGVVGEGINHFFLVHVHLKAALYKILDLCNRN